MSYEKLKAEADAYYAAWKETDPTLGKFVADTITDLGKDRGNEHGLVQFALACVQDAKVNDTAPPRRSSFAVGNAYGSARGLALAGAGMTHITLAVLTAAMHHADSRLRGAATARERQIAALRKLFPEILK